MDTIPSSPSQFPIPSMAGSNKRSSFQAPRALFPFFPSLIFILHHFLPCAIAKPLNLSFSWFGPNTPGIDYQEDATPTPSGEIELTRNRVDRSLQRSVGRAIYDLPLHLWDKKTGKLVDFTTHFSFAINFTNPSYSGYGHAFFLVTNGVSIPPNSTGGFLALLSNRTIVSSPPAGKTVAVEFNRHENAWDPSNDHVGIDINDIVSAKSVPWNASIKNGKLANAWISYNSTTHNLSGFLTYEENPIFCGNSTLYLMVDLRKVLAEWVNFGFSAATGDWVELHKIHAWSSYSSDIDEGGREGKKTELVVGLTVGIGILVSCLYTLMAATLALFYHLLIQIKEF